MKTRAPSRLIASWPAVSAEYCARNRFDPRSITASDGALFACDRSDTYSRCPSGEITMPAGDVLTGSPTRVTSAAVRVSYTSTSGTHDTPLGQIGAATYTNDGAASAAIAVLTNATAPNAVRHPIERRTMTSAGAIDVP